MADQEPSTPTDKAKARRPARDFTALSHTPAELSTAQKRKPSSSPDKDSAAAAVPTRETKKGRTGPDEELQEAFAQLSLTGNTAASWQTKPREKGIEEVASTATESDRPFTL